MKHMIITLACSLFLIFQNGSVHAVGSTDYNNQVLAYLKSLKSGTIAQGTVLLGVLVTEVLKQTTECNDKCQLVCYAPLIPGGLLIAHELLSNYLPPRR